MVRLPRDDSSTGLPAPAFSPDGRLLTLPTPTGISLWDTTTNTTIGQLPGREQPALAFSPDAQRLAVSNPDNSITIWNVPDQTEWATLTAPASTSPNSIAALAWNPSGTSLAAGSGTVSVWTTDTKHANTTLCYTLTHNFPDQAHPLPAACSS
ncbi:hypothetical protein HUO13_15245 [Saccharopolyspora erythraea]|nr:hypothetical protein HUO13_15245 [Saccharopolyspora erythraea]